MDADRRNDTGIFRYTDVEYTPEGHTDAYRWDDFLGIAGGHVYSAMDTIDMVSTDGQYEGDEPEHAYACEIVGCCGLSDGVALFRPVSHDGADLIQIAFLRNDVDDATGAYTERFEAGSFDLPAADLPRSEFGVDLLEYFSGRSFKYTPGVSRGLDPREAVDSIEDAIGCDLGLFDGFWLGVPGEADMRVGPYTKKSLLDFSYYAKRKRPITCLESGVTYDSAYRAAKELGFADSRNIFRSIQRGTCTQGLHFYYADEPKPAPEFFIPPNRPPRPVVCLDTDETFESAFQAGRAFGIAAGAVRTSASTGVGRNGLHFYYGDEPKPAPEFFRERHSKTRPIVCLETGETFMGNPAAARPLHVSPAAISQAVRDGTPIDGLHFYYGDEPKPAPEFFKPEKVKGGKSPAQMAAAARAAAGSSGRPDGGQRQWRAV